jgi:hypothetical protein
MILLLLALLALSSCYREPPLHLYDIDSPAVALPIVELSLDTYWDYDGNLGINYDWRAEWYYGWDDEDRSIFGELEYEEPTKFFLRRYYTGEVKEGTRIDKKNAYVSGRTFRAPYDWGFWDILAWNDVKTIDGVQSLQIEEKSSYDEDIIASTGTTMYSSRYHAPRYQNSFYEPEQLFSACEKGVEINKNLDGFEFDEDNNIWIRKLNMYLEPLTYIYLPQIILHNNNGRIDQVTSNGNISGMARFADINTGFAGEDAIAVNFKMRLKTNKDFKAGEKVDIVGGRLMTFGICGQNANRITRADEENDTEHHYIDVQLQFNNGMDSIFVFDVTDQVRKRYKGGVITVELDMDTVPTPKRSGGSGFNAIVKGFEEELHEIEIKN